MLANSSSLSGSHSRATLCCCVVNVFLLSSCAVQWDPGGAAALRCDGNAYSLTVDANAAAFRITQIVEAEKEASDGAFTRATRAHKGNRFSCWDLLHTKRQSNGKSDVCEAHFRQQIHVCTQVATAPRSFSSHTPSPTRCIPPSLKPPCCLKSPFPPGPSQ